MNRLSSSVSAPIDAGTVDPPLRGFERIGFWAVFVITGLLRVFYVFRYRVNSDEPQHLHVAWGWSQGLVQYRDLFDNHTPLFHLLSAPLVALVGERADILILMRFAVLPLFAGVLWIVYRLGRRLFGMRGGLWAAALLALYPAFFFCMTEYRADDLWVFLQVLCLLTLLGGRFTWKRGLVSGLLLGAATCTSMKTLALILALILTGIVWLCLVHWGNRTSALDGPKGGNGERGGNGENGESGGNYGKAGQGEPREVEGGRKKGMGVLGRHGWSVVAMGVGLMIPLLALGILMVSLGAWDAFIYCVFTHNIVPGDESVLFRMTLRREFVAVMVVLLTVVAWRWMRSRGRPASRYRGAFLLILVPMYGGVFSYLWPVLQMETRIAYHPLIALALGGAPAILQDCFRIDEWLPRLRYPFGISRLVLFAALLETAGIFHKSPPWQNHVKPTTGFLALVLKLTDRTDYVMDFKGESVFRRRPYYYVLERFTQERIRRGLLPDTIVRRCEETDTCVVASPLTRTWGKERIPRSTAEQLKKIYVSTGDLSVAGGILSSTREKRKSPYHFEVVIPTKYAIMTDKGPATGLLDGVRYSGPRYLPAGRHVFLSEGEPGDLAFLWYKAAERGFSPFHLSVSAYRVNALNHTK